MVLGNLSTLWSVFAPSKCDEWCWRHSKEKAAAAAAAAPPASPPFFRFQNPPKKCLNGWDRRCRRHSNRRQVPTHNPKSLKNPSHNLYYYMHTIHSVLHTMCHQQKQHSSENNKPNRGVCVCVAFTLDYCLISAIVDRFVTPKWPMVDGKLISVFAKEGVRAFEKEEKRRR